MNLDLTQVIENGATKLDAAAPGWVEAVDTARLEMRSTADCVLGQVFGDYAAGKERFGLKDCSAYGFIHPRRHVASGGHDEAFVFARLDRQWAEYVEIGRSAARLVTEAERLPARTPA